MRTFFSPRSVTRTECYRYDVAKNLWSLVGHLDPGRAMMAYSLSYSLGLFMSGGKRTLSLILCHYEVATSFNCSEVANGAVTKTNLYTMDGKKFFKKTNLKEPR